MKALACASILSATTLLGSCVNVPPMPPRYTSTPLSPSGRVPVAEHVKCLNRAIELSPTYKSMGKFFVAVGDTGTSAGTSGTAGSVVPTDYRREITDVLIANGLTVAAHAQAEDSGPPGYASRADAALMVEVSLSGYEAMNDQFSQVLNGGLSIGGGKGAANGRAAKSVERAEGTLRAVATLSRAFKTQVDGKPRVRFVSTASAPVHVNFRMEKRSEDAGVSIAIGFAAGSEVTRTRVQGPNMAAIAAVRAATREVIRDYFQIPAHVCRVNSV